MGVKLSRNKHQTQPELIRKEHLLRAAHTIRREAENQHGKGQQGDEMQPHQTGADSPCPVADFRQDTSALGAAVSLSEKWG